MEKIFTVVEKFNYSSLENLFRFVRLHFLTPLIGKNTIAKYVIDTNMKHLASSVEAQQQRSSDDLPEPTDEDIFAMLLEEDKWDRFSLAELNDSQLAQLYKTRKDQWFKEKKNISGLNDKFTKPERRISVTLNQDYTDEGFAESMTEKLNGSDSLGGTTIFENNLGLIDFTTRYIKFSGSIKIHINNNVECYDMANQLFNMLPITKFFFMDQLFKYSIKIPQGFRSFIKMSLNQTEEENWRYMQDYSKGRISSARDGATGEHIALFFLYSSNPYVFIESFNHDIEEKVITIDFKLEAAVPRMVNCISALNESSITPLLFNKHIITVQSIKNIINDKINKKPLSDARKDEIAYNIIKFNIDYLIKYKVELGLSDLDIKDIQEGYKLTAIDTSGLTREDIEFINEYSTAYFKAEEFPVTHGNNDDIEFIESSDPKPDIIIDYEPIIAEYVNIKTDVKEFIITNDTVLANLDNDIDNIKVTITGYPTVDFEIEAYEEGFRVLYDYDLIGFLEVIYYRKKGV